MILSSAHKIRSFIILLLILIFIDCIFFSPLFIPKIRTFVTPEFGGGDSITVQIPYRYFQCTTLKKFKLPFWSSLMSSGYPLLAEGEIGAFNPINWIACIFSDPQLVFNIQIMLHTLVFQVGLLLLAGKFKLSRMSAIYVVILLPFAPLFVMNYMQATLLFPFVYIPYLLYFYLEFIEMRKLTFYIFFVIFLILQFLTSHYQSFFVSSVALFVYIFVYLFTNKKKKLMYFMSFFIFAYLLSLGIAGFQTLPGWEFFQQSNRASNILGSFGAKFSQTFTFKNFLTLFSPFIVGDPKVGNYPFSTTAHPWEGTLYIYLAPLFCLIINFFSKKKKASIYGISTLITLIFMVLLVMGNDSPIYFIQSIPPFSSFRFPTRFTFVIIIILSFYSAYGFEYAQSLVKSKKAKTLISVTIIAAVFFEAMWFTYRFHVVRGLPANNIRISRGIINPKARIYVPYVDSMLFNKYYAERGYANKDSERYLDFILSTGKSNWNIIQGTTSYNTEIGPQLARYPYFISEIIEKNSYNFETRTASFSGLARAILTRGAVTNILSSFTYPSSEDFISVENSVVLPSSRTLHNYRINSPNYRVHIVDSFVVAATYIDVLTNMLQNRNEVIVEDQSITLASSTAKLTSSAVITHEADESVRILATSNKEALLILADSYYPGWHAYINGTEVPIFKANFLYRGIKIPQGKSNIIFKYIPQSFYYGCILSVITLAVLGVFLHLIKRDFVSIEK